MVREPLDLASIASVEPHLTIGGVVCLFVPAPIEQKIVSRARRFLVYCIERSCDMNFGHQKFLAMAES